MTCYFYILYSEHLGKFYVGHTCDTLVSRLLKHNSKHKGFTARATDWKIVYSEPYGSKSASYHRELEINSILT